MIRIDPLKKYKTVLTPDLLRETTSRRSNAKTLLFFFPRWNNPRCHEINGIPRKRGRVWSRNGHTRKRHTGLCKQTGLVFARGFQSRLKSSLRSEPRYHPLYLFYTRLYAFHPLPRDISSIETSGIDLIIRFIYFTRVTSSSIEIFRYFLDRNRLY